ncbi:flagellar motor switch protein FliN [gamma proteobacterium NOR5-3]|nr:flagellar motor switch protein FliN [gamma proteobacterium NOR5-3]
MSDEETTEAVAAQPPEELHSTAAPSPSAGGKIDLDLLMDVQVTLSVEIGRTRLPIKDLLALNQGSIVSLDRGVKEPLDLMVNGTLIARGEVVESAGQFGLRLIDVVSPSERLKKLK